MCAVRISENDARGACGDDARDVCGVPLAVLILIACCCGGCGRGAQNNTVAGQSKAGQSAAQPARTENVELFAAASTQDALKTIVAAFEQHNRTTKINTNYGASGTLAQQISAGSEADIFLSADDKWTVELADQDKVAEQVDLLANRLVVIVPDDSTLVVSSLEDLLKPEIKRLAVGDPEVVPAGDHAKRALSAVNVWNGVQDKLATSKDVRQALTYVETGAADAGIVYTTDVAASDRVKATFPIDTDLSGKISYPLALLKAAGDKPAARRLYEYLQSDEALRVFRQHGFSIHTPKSEEQQISDDKATTAEQDVDHAAEAQP